MKLCRRCKADMSGERLNHRTICFACQRRTLKARYKRIYQRRKARNQETP